jgi:SAM-dependent methyltransferase
LAERLESWHSRDYVAQWTGDDVIADLLELPRQISAAIVRDADVPVSHVVDLGSGHGPYLELYLRAFATARGTWVDSSEAMGELARQRLAEFGDRVSYVLGDLEDLDNVPLEPADDVLTSRVLHHFSPESLARIYRRVHQILLPGRFFFNLDHVGAPGDWEQRYRRIRAQFTGARKQALKPHRHDYPLASVEDHLRWAAEAGFVDSDVAWRMLYSALIVARKPA